MWELGEGNNIVLGSWERKREREFFEKWPRQEKELIKYSFGQATFLHIFREAL